MKILVAGCGKLGSHLSNMLSGMGHDVTVVDSDAARFLNLTNDFTGSTVIGVPIDQDVLKSAGIGGCDALAAVTADDNMNIMICQIASEVYKVPCVLSRIYDPGRSNVFSQFGLHTVCPTSLSVDAICSMLTKQDRTENLHFDSATVSFETIPPSPKQAGTSISKLLTENSSKSVLFGVLHQDGSLDLAHPGMKAPVGADDRLLIARVIG